MQHSALAAPQPDLVRSLLPCLKVDDGRQDRSIGLRRRREDGACKPLAALTGIPSHAFAQVTTCVGRFEGRFALFQVGAWGELFGWGGQFQQSKPSRTY
jgi:hypothetical protein